MNRTSFRSLSKVWHSLPLNSQLPNGIKFHQNRSINNGHYGQKYYVYALNMVRTSLTRFSWNSRVLNNFLLWTSEWESLLISGEEFRLWRSSLRSLLHCPVTPSFLGAHPQSMFLPQFRHQVTTPIKNGRQKYCINVYILGQQAGRQRILAER